MISIGKFGSFQSNHIIGRPYHLTFEILDEPSNSQGSNLRIVPASEIHSHVLGELASTDEDAGDSVGLAGAEQLEYEVVAEDGEVVMRTNRETVDEPGRQKLTMSDIEEMKKDGTAAGRDIISRLLSSHSGLEQKTAFSLAKYTLRKARKFTRQFTVLPMDVPILTHWLLNEKDPLKIFELRDEMIALMGSWANIHYAAENELYTVHGGNSQAGGGRWLMVDDTGGLVIAAVADRMGILYLVEEELDEKPRPNGAAAPPSGSLEEPYENTSGKEQIKEDEEDDEPIPPKHAQRSADSRIVPMSAKTNTITLIHANAQPNLSLLKYFSFDSNNPNQSHPLFTHLKTLSWLQLLSPNEDTGYTEPERIPEEALKTFKSGKRGNYYRKRRRWERVKAVVDETRAGGFDGLIVASSMDPTTILRHTVPLLRGAAQVVVYSPNIEPLAELADLYSSARRSAFVSNPPDQPDMPNEDFPLNPTLLLGTMVQTVRMRPWQCLPGRTHPMMTGRGGAEGYLFTGTRVLPIEGKVEARGKFKRRKVVVEPGAGAAEDPTAVKSEGKIIDSMTLEGEKKSVESIIALDESAKADERIEG